MDKKNYIIFFTLALILLAPDIFSQQMRYLNVNDGLSSRYTYGVEQDQEGFMWFATNEGIDRYDGNEFRSYKLISSAINPTELGYRFNIASDTLNNIWAYTTSGKVFRYNQFRDDFELTFELKKEFTGIFPYINTIIFDRTNTMWIGTTTDTYCAKLSGSKLEWIKLHSNLASSALFESDAGFIWSGTNDGVRILSLDNNFQPLVISDDPVCEVTKGKKISALYYDSDTKKLWIGSDKDGPSVYDFIQKKTIDLSFSTPPIPIRSIVKDAQNTILIGLDGAGIRRIDANNYVVKNAWTKTEDLTGGISDNSVLDLYCDADGRIWVSTWSAGITIIDNQRYSLQIIEHQFNNQNSIRNNQVNAIFEDSDGNLWFGTNAGVSILRKSGKLWNHLLDLENANDLSEYKTLTISEDNQKRIWIGGYGNGLHCYDLKTGKLSDFTSQVGINYIYIAFYDENGNMWFGGMEGLLTKMDLNNESFSKYNIKNVTVAINKSKDELWVGTTFGLFIIDKKTSNIIPDPNVAAGLAEVSNKYINCLFQDDDGLLWIGTNGGGMNLYDPEKNQIQIISTENGLPSNFIYGIYSDKLGRIWVSTEKGVGCYDPKTNNSINLGYIDKFENFLFNKNAHVKRKSGDLVLGGLNGAVVFTPENITPSSDKSKLVLNEFRISYQMVYPGERNSPLKLPVNQTSDIQLNYSQNSFSFRFSSINFNNTGQFVYQWKLEGFDSEWTPLTSNKTAGYTNIPPGDYTFKIRCSTQNNLEFDDQRQIAISIRPPFWKTNLAFISYFILFSGLFWLIYSLEQNRLLKKHATDKINFFIQTAHDIKTPVSLIKAPLKDIEADKGLTKRGLYYLKLAQSNAEKLAQVVNQILDFEKTDSKKSQLVLSNNNLISYLNEKINSYQLLADDNNIQFNFNLPDYEYSAIFDAGKMDKIIDNLFSNAIKFTPPNGKIELTVRTNDKEWTLELSDTGIGIPKKDRKNLFKMYYRGENAINSRISGTGIGLMLIRNLVLMHEGKINLNSQENIGSTFTLVFPKKLNYTKSKLNDLNGEPQKILPHKNITLIKETDISSTYEITPSQIKILIVEDEHELRNYLINTLGKQFHVYGAEDGKTALELVLKEKFDLVISDVMLPYLRGDELCRKIKTNIDTSHIPVILLTALSDKKNTIIGLEAGADSYIPKPFDIDLVNARINSILKNRQLISESILKGLNPNTDKVSINNLDKTLIKEILLVVERELSDPEFSITTLCREMAMSRTLLYNKIKAHTNLAPNEFIRIVRMNKAMDLLISGQYAISDVANLVGFQDSKYFSTSFKKFFGKSPKNYLNSSRYTKL